MREPNARWRQVFNESLRDYNAVQQRRLHQHTADCTECGWSWFPDQIKRENDDQWQCPNCNEWNDKP
jgi:predicted Zn-ribbon and HTH transcriptional regulator